MTTNLLAGVHFLSRLYKWNSKEEIIGQIEVESDGKNITRVYPDSTENIFLESIIRENDYSNRVQIKSKENISSYLWELNWSILL